MKSITEVVKPDRNSEREKICILIEEETVQRCLSNKKAKQICQT